jgi:hypothetical protein
VENQTLDFTNALRKPATFVYGHAALHAHMAAAVRERARLDAERTGAVPVPAPRRQRKKSLTALLRQSRKAGADRVIVDGVVIALSPAAAMPESVTVTDSNEWDVVLPEGDHGPH